MTAPDFAIKDEPWKILDLVASYWGASQNVEQPLYWIERPMGGKEYSVRFALTKNATPKTFDEVIKSCPEISVWLDAQTWNSRTQQENIQEFVMDEIKECRWMAERVPERNIVRCRPRRPPPLQWNYYDQLRKVYWSKLLSTENFGRASDQWAKEMKNCLMREKTTDSQLFVNAQLRRLLERQPNWEVHNGQSFRAWASNNKSWERVLDRMSVSYRVFQDTIPLILWAVDKNWSYGCKKWCEESALSLHFTPASQDVPLSWWPSDEDAPSGSIWHWACLVGSPALVKDLLAFDPSVLGATDNVGRTALHWACSAGRADVVSILLSKNASLSAEDQDGKIAAELVPDGFDDLFNHLEDLRAVQSEAANALTK